MNRHLWTLYNLGHLWVRRKRNTGLALVKLGLVTTPLWMLIRSVYLSYSSADNSSVNIYIKNVTADPSVLDWLGALVWIVGLILIIHERFFGEAAPQNRAKSVDMRSLKGALAPKLSDTYSATIDQAGVGDDLYFIDDIYTAVEERKPSSFLPVVTKKLEEFSKNFLPKARKEPMKPIAMGSIAHVPFCFALGFIVGNKSLTNFFCWNREKREWIDCRDKLDSGLSAEFEITQAKAVTNENVKTIGLSVEISFHSDEAVFAKTFQLDRCVKVSVKDQFVGNIFSDDEQTRLVSQVRDYVNQSLLPSFPNTIELHLTIMAQASFVMRLGAELNQNHIPKIFVYHFNSNQDNSYPWGLELTPGSEKVDWCVTEPLEKKHKDTTFSD